MPKVEIYAESRNVCRNAKILNIYKMANNILLSKIFLFNFKKENNCDFVRHLNLLNKGIG